MLTLSMLFTLMVCFEEPIVQLVMWTFTQTVDSVNLVVGRRIKLVGAPATTTWLLFSTDEVYTRIIWRRSVQVGLYSEVDTVKATQRLWWDIMLMKGKPFAIKYSKSNKKKTISAKEEASFWVWMTVLNGTWLNKFAFSKLLFDFIGKISNFTMK